MKTKIIAASVLALGIFSTGAFAESTTVLPVLPSNASVAPAPTSDLTAKQIAQLEHDFNAKYRANDGLAQNFADQVRPDARVILSQTESPTVVFSEPPSPAFYYDATAPAYWYPSVSLHFDWSRSRRG
jgi:hypothetical protein